MGKDNEKRRKGEQASGEEKASEGSATEQSMALQLEELKEAVRKLESEKEAAEKRTEELLDKFRRLQADFENYRKMSKRELETITQLANEKLMVRLLTVLDALENAMRVERTDDPKAGEALREGMKMVLREMKDVLETEGLAEIETEGVPLDPRKHEVVTFVETGDHPENTILRELRRGYTLRGNVIRPSMVEVVKHPQSKEERATEQPQEGNSPRE